MYFGMTVTIRIAFMFPVTLNILKHQDAVDLNGMAKDYVGHVRLGSLF
jgi:hypothetical protein